MGSKAKLELIASMVIFGTIGIFVRYIPLPSSFIAVVRGFVGGIVRASFSFPEKKQS